MSTLYSSSSLRPSKSASTFPQSTGHDPILLTRRASSEDSMTLPRSIAVSDILPKTIPLSSSSSAQSSLSFVTSVSASSHTSNSSSKAATDTSVVSNIATIEHLNNKDHEVDDEVLTPTPLPTKKSSVTHSPINAEAWSPPTSGSRSTSASPGSERSQQQPPIFFGDYLFPENPTLRDLRQVFLLDKSSKQKDFRQSLQLHAHLMGLALSARVSRGLDLAYDHAHDAFKNRQRPDRRNEFISIFNYTHDETERILHHALAHPQPRPSFFDMMSPSSSTAILTFLHRLRTDHTILATAFRNLQSQELDVLLLPERPSLTTPSQAQLRANRERSFSTQVGAGSYAGQQSQAHQQTPGQQRQLQQSNGLVPNFINNQDIVQIILANLFGPSSFGREHQLRVQAVKSIFVTLISEKKGERLMTEILERHVAQSEWQQSSRVKAGFEKILLDIIHRGDLDLTGFSDEELNANVLPHQHQHYHTLGRTSNVPVMRAVSDNTVTAHIQHGIGPRDSAISPTTIEPNLQLPEMTARQAMVEEFYLEACLDILDALTEFSPPCLMELSRLVFADLDQSAKPYASLVIIVKFFFYRFMNKCIAYPETYGMLQDIFISEKQRQRILFTTHQRLYRYVTGILNPVPGWENRALIVDQRIRDKIENFVSLFSSPAEQKESPLSHYTLNPITELSTPTPVPVSLPKQTASASSTVTPFLLLCPSDFTTLFYFVCPYLRTAASSSGPPGLMTRSSSFSGKSNVVARQRTSSETPPTYPAATRAVSGSTTGASGTNSTVKPTHPPSSTRNHKRASPSFSFFSGASASLPFKSRPPQPHLPLEKVPSAPEPTISGLTLLSLSGIKPGQAASPKTAAVEVTSTLGIAAASCVVPPSGGSQNKSSESSSFASYRSNNSPIPIKHWTDESLLPDLKAAVVELRRVQLGPVKEVPWVVNNPGLSPLREPWALAYVQYGDDTNEDVKSSDTTKRDTQQDRTANNQRNDLPPKVLAEVGLALAPTCMAMVMENSALGGGSRIVTVTKPMLVDQVMDSAGSRSNFESSVDLDFEVEESDNESLLSSEDASLAQRPQALTAKDKDMSILRVNSSQMLSLTDESGTKSIPVFKGQDPALADLDQPRTTIENPRFSTIKRAAADRAWKTRIRQTVHSEADLPEEIRTVARSVFKILREFDVLVADDYEEDHWNQSGYRSSRHVGHNSIRTLLLQGIEQARHFGNHAAAIGFHHSLRVLDSSPVLRQLDSCKIIYLLAMPIKHRLEHRAGRSRSRTLWEGLAHSWHTRLVSAIERKRESLSSLRIKMYYQTCVRTSRAFEKSLGVIVTLSRLNRAALRKYLSADEWERCNGQIPNWNETEPKFGGARYPTCDNPGCKGSCLDQPCQVSCSEAAEVASRRYSANPGHNSHLKAPKVRRSSFSTYIDNMTSRPFGPSSFLESSLSNLKEKEQASFSSSFGSGHQGMPWSGNNSNLAGSIGSLSEAADIQGDFSMDARETEAVQRWIADAGIHNFLPGEDNFLRFCMEVESVVRGVGLGGTGIQGAGIPQAQNGTMLPTLSNSGSDFFVKEVAKFNGQFVAGMGPSDQTSQAKPSGGGVAEFLVNSFKHGHSASSVPTTTGNYFFSPAGSSTNSTHGTLNSNGSSGSQSSTNSANGVSASSTGGRSKGILRQVLNNNHQSAQEAIPFLQDDPSSVYAFPTGPTYALYNPPYSTSSHGASSSYSGSLAPGGSGGSSTSSPHQISQLPKDMAEFLRRAQLTLTSFVLSEWLDLFGEVEADRWFVEFLDEMSMKNDRGNVKVQDDSAVVLDTNQDEYFVPLNQMDVRDKAHGEQCLSPSTTASLTDLTRASGSARSSIHIATDSNLPVSGGSNWHTRGSRGDTWTEETPQQQLDFGTDSIDPEDVDRVKPSASTSTFSTARSLMNTPSVVSVLGATVDSQKISAGENLPCDTIPGVSQRTTVETSEKYQKHNQSPSDFQAKSYIENESPLGVGSNGLAASYNLTEAYWSTMEQFNSAKSPYQKLGYLFSLELLIVASLSYPDSCASELLGGPSSHNSDNLQGKPMSRNSRDHDQTTDRNGSLSPESPRAFTPGTDAIVNEIESLFRKPGILRPRHLLRDMQLIATFIPGSILDLRDDGKAFWDMALAISSLKSEVTEYIVEKGSQYVEVEESSRTSQQDSDRDGGSRPITQDDEERTRMAEAVRLFTIGARESHPVAQRELAILYMSLPMLPSSASPSMGYSPLINQISRMPSPISIATSKFVGSSIMGGSTIIGGRGPIGRTSTPPPSTSPKGTFSSSFLGKSSTASIPIKQKARHQHSSSGSGSSFGSGMLSGLGIMTGLGSFTGSSSIGSGGSNEGPNNSSTASLPHHQHPLGEFAEGHHDVDHYQDSHSGRQFSGAGCCNGIHQHNSLHPHRQHPQHQQYPPNSSGPDKFNPENVAAAMHWFTLAAAQGDKFSINYLKHKETAGGMLGSLG
ncbi:hypothetical protein BGX26_011098 [Mortierella sp. AD094]|nr:hypothetical protein BGX26_011098 [Mortierella sp. AD094]